MEIVYFTKDEAAQYMRVSTSTVDRWVRDDRIRRYKIEGTRSARFKKDELDALIVLDPVIEERLDQAAHEEDTDPEREECAASAGPACSCLD